MIRCISSLIFLTSCYEMFVARKTRIVALTAGTRDSHVYEERLFSLCFLALSTKLLFSRHAQLA